MNFEHIFHAVQMHYDSHPIPVVIVTVCVFVVAYLRPRVMAKTLVGVGCLVLCAMAFTSLNSTVDSSVHSRDVMLDNTR